MVFSFLFFFYQLGGVCNQNMSFSNFVVMPFQLSLTILHGDMFWNFMNYAVYLCVFTLSMIGSQRILLFSTLLSPIICDV